MQRLVNYFASIYPESVQSLVQSKPSNALNSKTGANACEITEYNITLYIIYTPVVFYIVDFSQLIELHINVSL